MLGIHRNSLKAQARALEGREARDVRRRPVAGHLPRCWPISRMVRGIDRFHRTARIDCGRSRCAPVAPRRRSARTTITKNDELRSSGPRHAVAIPCSTLRPTGPKLLMVRASKMPERGEHMTKVLAAVARAGFVPARGSRDRVRHVRLDAALPGDRHGRRRRRRLLDLLARLLRGRGARAAPGLVLLLLLVVLVASPRRSCSVADERPARRCIGGRSATTPRRSIRRGSATSTACRWLSRSSTASSSSTRRSGSCPPSPSTGRRPATD